MVEKCIEAPESLKYDILHTLSGNKWNYRDLVETYYSAFVHCSICVVSRLFAPALTTGMKPSEYLARHVRGTPLSGGNDTPLPKIVEDLPEGMILFSSDFPHFEGFTDPAAYYKTALADLPQARRESFFHGAAEAIFARMGDPIH